VIQYLVPFQVCKQLQLKAITFTGAIMTTSNTIHIGLSSEAANAISTAQVCTAYDISNGITKTESALAGHATQLGKAGHLEMYA